MIGSKPARPRHSRTARSVTRASVPLDSAMLKSSVTPIERHEERRRESLEDGIDTTCRRQIDADEQAPSPSDRTPTLMVVTQLTSTAQHERADRQPGEVHRVTADVGRCRHEPAPR